MVILFVIIETFHEVVMAALAKMNAAPDKPEIRKKSLRFGLVFCILSMF